MKTVSLLEFRKNARQILNNARRGQRMIMTYRGKPICRIEPIIAATPRNDDPFYRLYQLADTQAHDMTNEEMDTIIYET
jgi:antitoxin (DNA-binding transcriptional repressor) of toxin-antitoxin stability system